MNNVPALLDPQTTSRMPLGLQMIFDDALSKRIETTAQRLSKAQGFVPPHLLGKVDACVAVVVKAVNWNLDPWAVAASTYEAGPGKVGFEGKLIQAILESSGRFDGGPSWEDFGPWERVEGKYEMTASAKDSNRKFPRRTWTDKDAEGIGTRLYWKLKGELEPRSHEMRLVQCQPMNSTLWATDPRTQIKYRCMRAFSNVATPHILMGVPFEEELEHMRDITPPRPRREDFRETGPTIQPAPGTESDAEDAQPSAGGGRETATEPAAASVPDAADTADRYNAAYALGQRAREAERQLEDGMPTQWIRERDRFAPEIDGFTTGWTDRNHELVPKLAFMDGYRRGSRECREGYSRNAAPAEWRASGREQELEGWFAGWDAEVARRTS